MLYVFTKSGKAFFVTRDLEVRKLPRWWAKVKSWVETNIFGFFRVVLDLRERKFSIWKSRLEILRVRWKNGRIEEVIVDLPEFGLSPGDDEIEALGMFRGKLKNPEELPKLLEKVGGPDFLVFFLQALKKVGEKEFSLIVEVLLV